MWLRHLQSGNSHEHQVGYCDSSQVWSQSQYRLPGPEEWLLYLGQSRHGTRQLHLWRQIQRVRETLTQKHVRSTHIECTNQLDYIIGNYSGWSHSFCFSKPVSQNQFALICTYCWESKLSVHNSCIRTTPGVITHSAPCIIVADFHSTLVKVCTTSKPDGTVSTWCCSKR